MTDRSKILNDGALDTLFREARTYNAWQNKPISDVVIRAIYDLLRFGPTSANSCPARFVFIHTDEAKQKLKPCLDAGNADKTMEASAVAIIINDSKFYEKMPQLFPPNPKMFDGMIGNEKAIAEHVTRNATLQGAYLMMAARSLGLDCGPMSGFDKKKIKETFFADQPDWEANFICSLGYGDATRKFFPRLPRLPFDDACEIV